MKQERDAKGRFLPKDKVYATGIKGFLPGLICEPDSEHRKQYKENTVFKEPGGEICGPGVMHAADTAADVLDYVKLINDDGTLFEFAEVEALAPVQREGTKWATTKMRIGKKLSFEEFVKSFIHAVTKSIADVMIPRGEQKIASSGNRAQIGSSGGWTQIASSGDGTRIVSSGGRVRIASSGGLVQIASSGDGTQIASSGNASRIASSGNGVQIADSGGLVQIASSGDGTQIGSSGNASRIASYGDAARIVSSGIEARINASGNDAKICSSGIGTKIVSKGADAVIAAIGEDSVVTAELGSWVVIAEYNKEGKCICIKSAQIDGINLKPGVRYKLENGEFKEVN